MSNVARLALLIVLGGASACGPRNSAQPLKDGSWEVKCEDQVDRCVREAQRVCGDEPYHVISGRKEEEIYGGESGYQTGVEVHVLEFRCGSDPAVWKLERQEEAAPEPEPEPAPGPPPKKKLCMPGSTQRCVGPGACDGGQSCNAEGTGYSSCDCGTPSPEAPPAASAAPAAASSAAPPPASATPPASPAPVAPAP